MFLNIHFQSIIVALYPQSEILKYINHKVLSTNIDNFHIILDKNVPKFFHFNQNQENVKVFDLPMSHIWLSAWIYRCKQKQCPLSPDLGFWKGLGWETEQTFADNSFIFSSAFAELYILVPSLPVCLSVSLPPKESWKNLLILMLGLWNFAWGIPGQIH